MKQANNFKKLNVNIKYAFFNVDDIGIKSHFFKLIL